MSAWHGLPWPQRSLPGIEPMSSCHIEVLLALIEVHRRDGRATVRAVATHLHRSLSTTHRSLNVLRHRGLVTWDPNRTGTLRPLVEAAATQATR